jgi:hypothetical protein
MQAAEQTQRPPVILCHAETVSDVGHLQVHEFAAQTNMESKKRKNRDAPMGFRPTPSLRAAIVKWAERQADTLTLSQAVCRLVERGLAVNAMKEGGPSRNGQTRRARKMAGEAIDNMTDATATAHDKVARKRDLLNGPEEFSRVRVDRRKTVQ